MQTQLHVNGSLVLELRPETDIERLILAEMAGGAERGKKVTLSFVPDMQGIVSVAVEK